MAIKIDIHPIRNAVGKGETRNYVKVLPVQARTAEELERDIQRSCTLTPSDIRAVLSALREVAARDLSERGAFHIPQVGYFTLQVSTALPEATDISKAKGNNVGVRNILFRPEAGLLGQVRRGARFERLRGTTCSREWADEDLRKATIGYLGNQPYLTARIMQREFRLTAYAAHKWLRRLTDEGILLRQGSRNSPFYVLRR